MKNLKISFLLSTITFFLTTGFLPIVGGVPPQTCPSSLTDDAFVSDLALLSETVSWPHRSQLHVKGTCGTYTNVMEAKGEYDTLLRVYTEMEKNTTIFSFRPTQQTSEGGDIHNDRRLVACRFLDGSCYGMVNDRFQSAFLDLVEQIDDDFIESIRHHSISTVGHSLGGSLQLFMAVYLFQKYSIEPSFVLGFAGPFIGDRVFTDTYLTPLKEALGDRMWQIETVDASNPQNFDGTVEGYNVNNGDGSPNWGALPFNPLSRFRPEVPSDTSVKTPIFIDDEDLCGVNIVPFTDSYGMHDLRNYRRAFQGTQC